MKALILTDGKAGHENQSKALARALGCDFELLEVHFRSKLHKAASYPLDRLGVLRLGLGRPAAPWPASGYDVVIGTGSGTFYLAKALSRRLGVGCAVVLYPRGYRIATFDCVLAPAFDRPAEAPNVIRIPANLVAGDAAFYEKGVADFRARNRETETGGEITAVIVGGPNKCSTMTPEWMKAQLDRIFAPSGGRRPHLWVTTSRRTPPEVEAVVDSYPWDYRLIYSRDHFNPIPAFVSLASRLYVTAESTGMLSECCTFGRAKVFALDNLNPGGHKFRRFVEDLRMAGYLSEEGDPATGRKIDLSEQFAQARRLLFLS